MHSTLSKTPLEETIRELALVSSGTCREFWSMNRVTGERLLFSRLDADEQEERKFGFTVGVNLDKPTT
ncbi:MAG: hypothetical protein KDB00_03330 [Planctomycetales bacterium]|nr:hypothetical protein [Planctomycetales bacterium]